jgi:DNA-binding CsgD family transcriptional regulator
MGNDNGLLDNFSKMAGFDITGDTLPKKFVEMMIETNGRHALQLGHEKEREENVCRLLASGMSVEEISLVLKIRIDEIRIIGSNNAKDKIPEYTRTYKARLKSRERAGK